jgi:hypothetical protein
VETVVVLGYEHHARCSIAKYKAELEDGWRGYADGFPWCTCWYHTVESDLPRRVPWVMRGPWEW